LLPSDSLLAAQAELDFLQRRLDRETGEDQALAQAMTVDGQQLANTHRQLDALAALRRRRAVMLYRELARGANLDELLLTSSVLPETANTRRMVLSAAADRDQKRRTRRTEHALHDVEARLAREDRRRGDLAHEMVDTKALLTIVLDKLTAAAAALTLVGAQVPAPPGPSPIAIGARDTDLALILATSAQQSAAAASYRAAASSGDATLVTASAAASAAAAKMQLAFTTKRAALARLVGQALHGDGAPLELIWAMTPTPALHAVLFGLSQVGKPYVYATAGPDAYDCSGLTKRAWAETGVGLPHFSGAQLHVGLPIAPAQLRPGDLLTYGPDGSEHVVLYLGNGWVVQAAGRSSGVIVTPADVDPLHGFAGASRPIP
jgi:cell wall-associated NlpC family hydrolase